MRIRAGLEKGACKDKSSSQKSKESLVFLKKRWHKENLLLKYDLNQCDRLLIFSSFPC
jgi:hypothetical protein